MLVGLGAPPAVEAEWVITAVLADLGSGDDRGVVVDSPPVAGKSTLVVRAVAELAAAGDPLIIIAQTNEQVDDLIHRLAQMAAELRIGRLSAADYKASERVKGHDGVGAKVADLGGPAVMVGTAAKWATVTEGSWLWAVVDEVYQTRSDALLRMAGRFEQALFVGDPGQLDPFSTGGTVRWTGLTRDPMQSALAVVLRHNPELPVHWLSVWWRLPASEAPVVAAACYLFGGFRAGTDPGDRALSFTEAGPGDAVDATVEMAASSGWALYELPARCAAYGSRGGVSVRCPGAEGVTAGSGHSLRARDRRAGHRGPDRSRGSAPRPGRGHPRATRRGRLHRRYRQPTPGPRVRPNDRAASAVGTEGRNGVPFGVGSALRADAAAPARLYRGGPGGDWGAARRASVDRGPVLLNVRSSSGATGKQTRQS